MGEIVVEELIPDVLFSFSIPPFFALSIQLPTSTVSEGTFQVLDGAADQTKLGFQLGDPALDLLQAGLASAQGGDRGPRTWCCRHLFM
jgi:hypothetical protein